MSRKSWQITLICIVQWALIRKWMLIHYVRNGETSLFVWNNVFGSQGFESSGLQVNNVRDDKERKHDD